ncbi:hypothetical protein HOE37_04070 [Candidatus Woesearchaeota archaeon]|jgi:hypothetical protein|nr:hypothetical protein [Candidatus Woesearchaeota archaeon]MBT4111008.1 hypothetical protein [Candidatus Woesearchaeota archaeon]MBT4336877.1 hypothetical protein [Candidatus Woesearchaeota archaeon]MBT4469808.1 hypothetical protein [Candidatus Woesearchaeota archaeon]MBT6743721.1 hypothetical protein [Candidatus Woesearchaeota archaeon]
MTGIKYQKPVLETRPLFEPSGQVDLDAFYIAAKVIDEKKYVKMYQRELKAVMADKLNKEE